MPDCLRGSARVHPVTYMESRLNSIQLMHLFDLVDAGVTVEVSCNQIGSRNSR
jgi:hypothetical protein